MTDTAKTEVYAAPDDGLTGTVVEHPPNPHLVVYRMEPHIETAFWLIVWAILVLLAGHVIDKAIDNIRKNHDRDNNH